MTPTDARHDFQLSGYKTEINSKCPNRSDPAVITVIRQGIFDTPSGRKVVLSQVAQVLDATGPNTLSRENVSRRIVESRNVHDRSRGDVVAYIRTAVRAVTEKLRAKDGGKFRV